jgi:hypothetical protein
MAQRASPSLNAAGKDGGPGSAGGDRLAHPAHVSAASKARGKNRIVQVIPKGYVTGSGT